MRRLLLRAIAALFTIALIGIGAVAGVFWYYGRDLPSTEQLADYDPPIATRVYAGDGRLIGEYAVEKRIFVPYASIPPLVVRAFVAAEDQNFFEHPGVDVLSILRAVIQDVGHVVERKRPVGASTITQQVAKNFLLTNEVSVARKVKEILLAIRIEQTLSKERILELYVNEIYLGGGSYGIAAAALNYFNHSLDQLTLPEAAYLAALPKAPNNYNPVTSYDRAKLRRDWVIDRMFEDGYITEADKNTAEATAIVTRKRDTDEYARADYFAEEVRRTLAERYGENQLYRGGLAVSTSLDPKLQSIADQSFREGLEAYDRRHGWRGPVARGSAADVVQRLAAAKPPPGSAPWLLAGVTAIDPKEARIALKGGGEGRIAMSELAWARPTIEDQRLGSAPKTPGDVLQPGDLVLVAPLDAKSGQFALKQIPNVSGGLVGLDPHTGRVLAMTGGWSYETSQFNRAVQAMRQPGSSFKPFVYMAALDHGFTPSTIVLDVPFVLEQPGQPPWRPANYGNDFLGPVPLRVGIEQSRNLMTVRIAQEVGMDTVADYARRFGVVDRLDPVLAMSLGAGETTALRMATAYGMIVNGGKRIDASLIDRIQDKNGRTIYKHDTRACEGCVMAEWDGRPPPAIPDTREQVEDPGTAYQMVSMLEGVVQRGTATIVSQLKRPLAGKTGTTNDFTDAWFVGFSPDLVVALYVGFDQPRTLGPKETGGRISAPIFKAVMGQALDGQPPTPFRIPPGVELVRVDAHSGKLAEPGAAKALLVPFKPGTAPVPEAPEETIASPSPETPNAGAGAETPSVGIGGLY